MSTQRQTLTPQTEHDGEQELTADKISDVLDALRKIKRPCTLEGDIWPEIQTSMTEEQGLEVLELLVSDGKVIRKTVGTRTVFWITPKPSTVSADDLAESWARTQKLKKRVHEAKARVQSLEDELARVSALPTTADYKRMIAEQAAMNEDLERKCQEIKEEINARSVMASTALPASDLSDRELVERYVRNKRKFMRIWGAITLSWDRSEIDALKTRLGIKFDTDLNDHEFARLKAAVEEIWPEVLRGHNGLFERGM
ncbi:hypothetical protein M408DRAFT_327104 [Serendipita vermifera MAFF 305830]|uniref:Homologous-pairing protein 2 winged helix domain-containing protein n=1 Tax=Serendipita vermifera MAFF 305830 TaxID=933852 RepID=A0A0C2X012_SERVB|nr:hypothetical protein M408DRAFT_327104 [Serendipita vermifera MAFF 305830]